MSDTLVPVIAKIEGTTLGYEDHGILTAWLHVTYGGGSGQGVGGYALDAYSEPEQRRIGSAYGLEFIARTIQACGVTSWEKITGRTIYVLKEDDGWFAKVVGIENLPTEKGERFLFADLDFLITQPKEQHA